MAVCSICGNFHDRLGNRVRCWLIRNAPSLASLWGWTDDSPEPDNHNKILVMKEWDWYKCQVTGKTCPTIASCYDCLRGR